MLTQSADTADDERNILIGAPQSAPDDNAKSKRWRYGPASDFENTHYRIFD
jgi:hypothetical protein